MEILLWLVPAVVATSVAMVVAGWIGRRETAELERSVERPEPSVELSADDEGVSAARPARPVETHDETPDHDQHRRSA